MGNRRFSRSGREAQSSDTLSPSDTAGHRHLRLQELVHKELASLLRDDVEDPALYGIVVSAVVLSVDYRNARVHYTFTSQTPDETVPGREAPFVSGPPVDRALLRAAPFLRARLADALDLKRVPELRFVAEPH